MSAATMLVLIATVVAVLALSAAGFIWAAHPIETPIASCGTLRSPANSVLLARPVGTDRLQTDIEAALAPGHCSQARDQVRYSQQLALASGGIASATALGAWIAGRRERRMLEIDAAAHAARRQRNGSGLAGHALPGRPEPDVVGLGATTWSQLRPSGRFRSDGRGGSNGEARSGAQSRTDVPSADPGGPVH